MINDLIFVSAQPDVPYFHWQTEVYAHNFVSMGIRPEQIHIIFAMVYGDKPTSSSLKLKNKGINVHHYSGLERDRRYIPSLRPLILSQWLKEYPDLGKCYFYHDSDIIFRKLPNFEKLINDDTCYLSDTLSYIGYSYIEDCSRRYESAHPNLEKDKLIKDMCEIVNIPVEIVKNNQLNSGGAQYLIKNTDYKFWDKVFKDCVNLYNFLKYFHTTYSIQHEIQMWTSDMWALLWNLWLSDKETKISNELNFSWATDSLNIYESKNILHMAGVTSDLKNNKFYKGEFININPLDKLKENLNFFDYVDKNSSTIKYIETMKSLIKNG